MSLCERVSVPLNLSGNGKLSGLHNSFQHWLSLDLDWECLVPFPHGRLKIIFDRKLLVSIYHLPQISLLHTLPNSSTILLYCISPLFHFLTS